MKYGSAIERNNNLDESQRYFECREGGVNFNSIYCMISIYGTVSKNDKITEDRLVLTGIRRWGSRKVSSMGDLCDDGTDLYLDGGDHKPVNPKGNQPWLFTGRTHAEAEVPIFWPPDVKSQLIGKDPDAGKDWRQEKGMIRGWDGWMASLTQWIWVWASSRRWWRTGKPGMLQSMGFHKESDTTEQQISVLSCTEL